MRGRSRRVGKGSEVGGFGDDRSRQLTPEPVGERIGLRGGRNAALPFARKVFEVGRSLCAVAGATLFRTTFAFVSFPPFRVRILAVTPGLFALVHRTSTLGKSLEEDKLITAETVGVGGIIFRLGC
jgi:hypothetical protein